MTENDAQNLGYAGDISPKEAWQKLVDDPRTVLIDVRTPEEWSWVGTPNLDDLDRDLYFVPWAFFPNMAQNPGFVDQVQSEASPKSDTPMLFLCRSGVRSVHAARALTDAGFTACYNITCGFEGDPNENGQRGKTSGWKVDGLSWNQK